jgi:phosphoribosylformylglycinamidine (FGAM) synthase-like enzyme
MRTQWKDEEGAKKVTSPVSLIVTAFATLADVRGTLTPQLNATDDTTLVLVDLGRGQNRMGGSILSQTLGQLGDEVPDLDHPQDLVNLVNAVNALRAQGQILAYHDRSDGGLLAPAIAEMAFAGHVGVALNVDHAGHRRRRHHLTAAWTSGDSQELGQARSAPAAKNSRSKPCSAKSWAWCCRCARLNATL